MKGLLLLFVGIVVVVVFCFTAGNERPTVSPTSQVCYLNKTATFHCNGRLGGPGWNLNSTPLHLQGGSYNTNITGLTLTLECSLKLNNSEVTCYDYSNPGLASEPAQLKVQGLLGQVTNLQYLKDNQTLIWGRPFQLNVSASISYKVKIQKIDLEAGMDSDPSIMDDSNYNETSVDLHGKLEMGSSYNVSVRAVNAVGDGEEDSFTIDEDVINDASSDKPTTGKDKPRDNPDRRSLLGGSIGAVVAVLLLAVLVVVIILLLIYKMKNRRKKASWDKSPGQSSGSNPSDQQSSVEESSGSGIHGGEDETDGPRRRK